MDPAGLTRLNVMVIDPNSLHLHLIQKLLHQCNHNGMSFTDVSEAISFVMNDHHGLDIIISDVFLPNEEGLFVLKIVSSLQLHIPVISKL